MNSHMRQDGWGPGVIRCDVNVHGVIVLHWGQVVAASWHSGLVSWTWTAANPARKDAMSTFPLINGSTPSV